jgi:hypothetical protein
MKRTFAVSIGAFAALLLLALAACGGGNSALNPAFQPQVANLPDNFQFQTTGVTNVTQTLHYTWQNSGTAASVNQACAITSGTAFVTLRDPNGNARYSADLKANGTFTSVVGTSGAWTIDVVLTNLSGTLNFRVQKM